LKKDYAGDIIIGGKKFSPGYAETAYKADDFCFMEIIGFLLLRYIRVMMLHIFGMQTTGKQIEHRRGAH
jgi:hypothetical protein